MGGDFSALEPIPADPKVAGITDRLLSAIAAGEFLPGSRLPSERVLAESLAVGRGTVRLALKRLGDRGYIETRRGRSGGAFVLDVQARDTSGEVDRVLRARLDELREAVDASALMYALIAETAALRRTAEDLSRIALALDVFAAAVDADDAAAAQAADARFHDAILVAAHQPLLGDMLRLANGRISIGTSQHIWGPPDQHSAMQQRALRDHRAILAAITAGDRVAAFDLSHAHEQIDLDIIIALLAASDSPG
ncbi:FadR/GntR family transcriptional regulator [Leucobacter sp. NPDC058333]|uniref:FadR/GntR family transcriptional regulator n=1 Tax=Leucobacter sp. NPDC058333 TaxID=3346450 RepID=UPI00365E7981